MTMIFRISVFLNCLFMAGLIYAAGFYYFFIDPNAIFTAAFSTLSFDQIKCTDSPQDIVSSVGLPFSITVVPPSHLNPQTFKCEEGSCIASAFTAASAIAGATVMFNYSLPKDSTRNYKVYAADFTADRKLISSGSWRTD